VNAKVDVPKLMHVQKTLKALDYSCHCTGKMDAATVEAIQLFQKDHGLKVDGQLTPETVSAIEKVWEDKVKKAEQEAAGQ
jgi:peptidoglycan hydrolase-like protein with peptidoglycan-binding domain